MLDLSRLSDDEVTRGLSEAVREESKSLALVLLHIAEFDKRRLHAPKNHASTFAYCRAALGYSEGAAYKRITAARTAAKYPSILSRIEDGLLSLTAVVMLAPHLTPENQNGLLNSARGKGRYELEKIIAALAPQPDRRDHVQRLEPALPLAAPLPDSEPLFLRQSVHPTAPDRVRFAFTADEALLALLKRAQDVLRHKYPAGELEKIFREALELLLEKRDPDRRLAEKDRRRAAGQTPAPRQQATWAFASRHIPQEVQDEVRRRDGGQCVYLAADGRRCAETGGLEYDHITPFALGGASNDAANIRLLCRTHNQLRARETFGPLFA